MDKYAPDNSFKSGSSLTASIEGENFDVTTCTWCISVDVYPEYSSDPKSLNKIVCKKGRRVITGNLVLDKNLDKSFYKYINLVGYVANGDKVKASIYEITITDTENTSEGYKCSFTALAVSPWINDIDGTK